MQFNVGGVAMQVQTPAYLAPGQQFSVRVPSVHQLRLPTGVREGQVLRFKVGKRLMQVIFPLVIRSSLAMSTSCVMRWMINRRFGRSFRTVWKKSNLANAPCNRVPMSDSLISRAAISKKPLASYQAVSATGYIWRVC